MIEEKMIISFTEYLSCFDDEGEYINDSAKGNAESCIRVINEAVNRFIAGVESIAHHDVSFCGNNFHASVEVSAEAGYVSLSITRDNCSGILASYDFEAKSDLMLSKSYNMVSIE